jgi:hypothetical protein
MVYHFTRGTKMSRVDSAAIFLRRARSLRLQGHAGRCRNRRRCRSGFTRLQRSGESARAIVSGFSVRQAFAAPPPFFAVRRVKAPP